MTNLRKEARGEECQIRIEGVCNFDSSTTVLCHLNGSGTGTKFGNADPAEDILGAHGCSRCHDAVDGRNKNHGHSKEHVLICFYEGVFRTQRLLIRRGKIKI